MAERLKPELEGDTDERLESGRFAGQAARSSRAFNECFRLLHTGIAALLRCGFTDGGSEIPPVTLKGGHCVRPSCFPSGTAGVKPVLYIYMQAVILAAGRGSRMGALTEKKPKPMLEVAGKTLLERKFDVLPESVDEIILVVGYLAESIKNAYGDTYGGKKITYVTQENIVGGTADALWQVRSLLAGKFVVMMGDDLYAREDISACLAYDWALLVKKVPDTAIGGRVIMDAENHVTDIIEGNSGSGVGMVNTNLLSLDTRIFDFPQVPKATGSSELGLPQTVLAASRAADIPLTVVEATSWIQITSPEDIRAAELLLSKHV